MTDQERFEAFTKELSQLSNKYGITIQSIGGVTIWDDGEIAEVEYSNDSTSGDLTAKVNMNMIFKCNHCHETSSASKWNEQTIKECGEISVGIEKGYNNANYFYVCPKCGQRNSKKDLMK